MKRELYGELYVEDKCLEVFSHAQENKWSYEDRALRLWSRWAENFMFGFIS